MNTGGYGYPWSWWWWWWWCRCRLAVMRQPDWIWRKWWELEYNGYDGIAGMVEEVRGQGVNDKRNLMKIMVVHGGGGGQIAHDRAGNFWTGDATSNTGGGSGAIQAGQYDNGTGPGFRLVVQVFV